MVNSTSTVYESAQMKVKISKSNDCKTELPRPVKQTG